MINASILSFKNKKLRESLLGWGPAISLCCGIVAGTALVVIFGWFFQSDRLIRIFKTFEPMQFNTAVALFCASSGLMLQPYHRRLSQLASIFVIAVSSLTLLEYGLGVNFGIETALIHPFTSANAISIGRMAPNTAFAVLFTGLALLLSSIKTTDERLYLTFAVTICASIVVALGVVPIIGKLSGVEVANLIWMTTGHTANHTAICLVLIGSCFMPHIYRTNTQALHWLPFPVFLSFLIVSVSLSTAVKIQENAKIDTVLQAEGNSIARKAQLQMGDLYSALDRIANRWTLSKGTPEALWRGDAQAYLQSYPFLTALSRTDADTHIMWLVSKEPPGKAVGFQLNSEANRKEAIDKALETHTSQTTRVLTLLGGQRGFLYVTPLYAGDHLDGIQAAAFRLNNLFNIILDAKELEQFYVTIEDESGNQLFSNEPEHFVSNERWKKDSVIQNKQINWTLHIIPTNQFLASKNTFVSSAVLGVGIFTACVLSICIYLLLKLNTQFQTLRSSTEIRQKLMAELAAAEELKRKIINSSSYMVIAGDANGTIHTFNTTAEKVLGYKATEIIGVRGAVAWHLGSEVEMRAKELSERFGRMVEPGLEVFTLVAEIEGREEREWTFVKKDRSTLPVSLIVTVLRDESGVVVGHLGIAKDISSEKESAELRRLAEEKLRISEERLYLASSGTSDGLWDWNIKTGEVYYSPRFAAELGYKESEMQPTIDTFRRLLHPDDVERTFKAVQDDHARRSVYNTDYRMCHKDGHYLWFNARGRTVWDLTGTPVRMTGFTSNIDKRKKAQEAFDKAHDELNLIFDNVNSKIWFKDNKNNILRLNQAAAAAMGGAVEQFINHNTAEFFPNDAAKFLADDLAVIASGRPSLGIVERFTPVYGLPAWVSTDKIPYEDKELGIKGVFVISTDITRLKLAEEQREQLVSKLTESNTELGRFAYVASHDMQEPLRMIANFGALINSEYGARLDEDGQQYLQIVTQSALRMQTMVDDLLEYARVGNNATRFGTIDSNQEMSHVLENLFAAVNERGALITYDNLPSFQGNPVQIMRLLQNLVSNGIKYQEEGTIPEVHISAEDKGSKWQFSVKDNGIGMNPEYVGQIFEPFKRLHTWSEFKGTGIGLAVCKKIVEGHGGEIWATSEPGHGSIFYFTVPKG